VNLDYYPGTGYFCLKTPRDKAQVRIYMEEHGLDFSSRESTVTTAALVTKDPYAASVYSAYGTPRALAQLSNLIPAIEASWAKTSERKCAVPEGRDLYPFQKAAMDYILDGGRTRALIGDEPGLGKTPQAIVLANEMRAKRVLVVCPANIRLQWVKQIRAWSTMEGKYLVYPILKSGDGVHPRAEWTVVSYDLLRSAPISEALRAGRYDLLILDEAHYLKSTGARRTKAVFAESGLEGSCGAILALTGTPLPNRPRECYTLSRALCHSAIDFASEREFQNRYNPIRVIERRDPKTGRVIGRVSREKTGRLPELQARLRANFMVRRLKRDVLDQLPEITYEIVHTGVDGDITRALEAEKLLDIDPEDLSGANTEILGHVSIVRRMMGVAKAPHVASYVDDVVEGGEEKIVLFGWHIEVLDILERALHKHGVVRVDGSTSPRRRQMAVDSFVENPKVKVFLGNLQSVGVGVDDLQKVCSRAIFAESSWTPSDNDQGVGRLERIGQKSGIFVEFIVAPGSFDERVLGSALRKLKNIHATLDQRL
jgi:SWI/SNF-related matrix-associated actin-dependent regulator 1 of chromatin subfamily A